VTRKRAGGRLRWQGTVTEEG